MVHSKVYECKDKFVYEDTQVKNGCKIYFFGQGTPPCDICRLDLCDFEILGKYIIYFKN